ncbi:hypothetical protein HDU98_007968, partial [Podochytrium sp. JEL0797]
MDHSLLKLPHIVADITKHVEEGDPAIVQHQRAFHCDMQNPVAFLTKLVVLLQAIVAATSWLAALELVMTHLRYPHPNRHLILESYRLIAGARSNNNIKAISLIPTIAKCPKDKISGWKPFNCFAAEVVIALFSAVFGALAKAKLCLVLSFASGREWVLGKLKEVDVESRLSVVVGGLEACWYCPEGIENRGCISEEELSDWTTTAHDEIKVHLWLITLAILAKLDSHLVIPAILAQGSDACRAIGTKSFSQKALLKICDDVWAENELKKFSCLHPTAMKYKIDPEMLPTISKGRVLQPKQQCSLPARKAVNFYTIMSLNNYYAAIMGSNPSKALCELMYKELKDFGRFGTFLGDALSHAEALRNRLDPASAAAFFGKPRDFKEEPLLFQVQQQMETEYFRIARETVSCVYKDFKDKKLAAGPKLPKVAPVREPPCHLAGIFVDGVALTEEQFMSAKQLVSTLVERREVRGPGFVEIRKRLDKRLRVLMAGKISQVYSGFRAFDDLESSPEDVDDLMMNSSCVMTKKPYSRYAFPESEDSLKSSIGSVTEAATGLVRDATNPAKIVGVK